MAKKKLTKRNYKKFIKWFWTLFLGGFLSIILLFIIISWGALGKLPTFEDLEVPEKNFASEIISSDGVLIGKYFKENRTPVHYNDIPKELVNALVATEDERFFKHSGIDSKGTIRAFVYLGNRGGASTITQQLAKLLFEKRAKNKFKAVLQKIKEWIIAGRLERQYTKQEIITMYLNKFDFLHNAIGIRSAARIYFGKEPIDLNLHESATLVGMLKNPSLYNPISRPTTVQKRRNIVFGQMLRNQFINQQEADSLKKLPLGIDYNPELHSDGYATYFRMYLQKLVNSWAKNNPKPDGTYYNLLTDGLKIHVTLNSKMQKYAEEAMSQHMANLQRVFFKEQKKNKTAPFYDLEPEDIEKIMAKAIKNSDRYRQLKKQHKSSLEIEKIFNTKVKMKIFTWNGNKDTTLSPYDSILYYKHFLHSGLLSMEPQTGHIKAWVGGINYKYFQYDHVKQGKRQVGSTFKPFVYASAIDQLKISPCEKFPNTPYTIPKGKYGNPNDWTPKNSGNKYGGELNLKQALAKSINVITARLVDMVGPKTVVRLAKRAGIESNILPVPSIALGTVDLSLYEMVGAYASFANKGLSISPQTIMRIEDKNGTVLQQFIPKTKEVMSETSAYILLELLQGVTKQGSGVRLRGVWGKYPDNIVTGYPYDFKNPIAGKTGTTQNQSDGWFMGIVPNLVTGVWTGASNRSVHFKNITQGQGATMSLPTWALYMQKCYADSTLEISSEEFEKPLNINIQLNCNNKHTENLIDKTDTPITNDETDF